MTLAMIEIHKDTIPLLMKPPYANQLRIYRVVDTGEDELFHVWFESPHLIDPVVCQEFYFSGNRLKFKRWSLV